MIIPVVISYTDQVHIVIKHDYSMIIPVHSYIISYTDHRVRHRSLVSTNKDARFFISSKTKANRDMKVRRHCCSAMRNRKNLT